MDDALLFCAADLETLKEIGARLHDVLFKKPSRAGGDLTGEFLALREAAALRGEGFDIRIDLSATPQLARVPWEALYLAADDLFLGIDAKSNIVRILAPDHPGFLPPAVEPPIRMLVAVANPTGELETGVELADIRLRLEGLLDATCTRYQLRTLPAATRSQFASQIEEWKPHIVHFIGHGGFGDERGLIYFHHERDATRRDPVDSATLRDLVRNDRPWLVVLNSCLSGAAARADPFGGAAQNLIRINVPFVVAMQSPVSDEAAVRFSQRFYASLMRRDPVATAVTRGRNAIRSLAEESFRAELITPVLYTTGAADAIEMADPPPLTVPEAPPVPPPGLWARRIVPALPTLNIFAGIVSALVAVATLYVTMDGGREERSAQRSVAEAAGAASAPRNPVELDRGGAEMALREVEKSRLHAAEQGPEWQVDHSAAVGNITVADLQALRTPPPMATRPDRPAEAKPAHSENPEHAAVRVPVPNAAPPGATAPNSAASTRLPESEPIRIQGDVRPPPVEIPRPGAAVGALIGGSADRSGLASFRVGPWRFGVRRPEPLQQAEAQSEAASLRSAQISALLAGRSSTAGDDADSFLTDLIRILGHDGSVMQGLLLGAVSGDRPTATSGDFTDVRSAETLIFSTGSWELTDSTVAKLERTALAARNGAGLQLRSIGEDEGREEHDLAERRLTSALDFLLRRGADPLLLMVAPDAPIDPGVASYLSLLGASSFVQIQTDGSAAAMARRAHRPVSILASFPFQSTQPLADDFYRYPELLTSPAGADLTLALTGHADPEEAAANAALGQERAQYVADRLRALGVPEAALRAETAPALNAVLNPLAERRVDGRLVLRGVERLHLAAEPSAITAEAATALDRLSGWLARYSQFGVHIGGTGDPVPGQASAGSTAAQTERLHNELQRRGIGEERIVVTSARAPHGGGSATPPPGQGLEISIVPLQ
jgi:hypothetical protein